jgi:hypothetical protein
MRLPGQLPPPVEKVGLAQISDPAQLEGLGEALLECEDEAAWLHRLQAVVQRSS